FPYRDTEEKIPWRGRGIGVQPSLALGGLSNVWGAATLPYSGDDIADWPITLAELAPHYRAAAEMLGLAGRRDDLEEILPLYAEKPGELRPSGQAKRLLGKLEKRRDALRAHGWRFGQSRLAVRAADSPRGRGCVYCRQCMTGCVYGCIYNSADTVRELQNEKNFSYQPDTVVTKLREEGENVFIDGFRRRSGTPFTLAAERVYVAAGVIPTAQILLRSREAYDQPVTLRDSQYFLFPILQFRGVGNVRREALHTLSQVFLELSNRRVSSHSVHLQVYTYSEIIGQAVRKSLGPLRIFGGALDGRLLIAQGYLHSDESAGIEMTLKRDGSRDVLEMEVKRNPSTRRVIGRVVRALGKQWRALGGFPVGPMLQVAPPGRGFHCGGSFPMRSAPGALETDVWGRLPGWARIHAVDASVLPAIPATTITLSAMANAHRIGAAKLD
ncbi:MAG TPA: hypothetical protein VFV81_09865, partial [Verrucomicrobiae bacterium]|nr:hypothetical protein [Verrucomicrobiae bacterium]